jgi:hypothetical protein
MDSRKQDRFGVVVILLGFILLVALYLFNVCDPNPNPDPDSKYQEPFKRPRENKKVD